MSNNQSQVHAHAQKQAAGFEVAISPSDLNIRGNCRIFEGHSTDGHQEVPEIEWPRRQVPTNGLIQYDQPWFLEFDWVVYGPLACLLDCGYWQTKVFFEQMGGGETNFSPEATTQDLGISGQSYRSRIPVRPYALQPGVYKVVVCLQYCLQDGSPGPIAGFHHLGMVKIYEDKRAAKYYSQGNGAAATAGVEEGQ